MNKEGPREYTRDEVRERLVGTIKYMCAYWDTTQAKPMTQRERLDGLAYSILTLLDGRTLQAPGFALVPLTNSMDREFFKEHGGKWYKPPPAGIDEHDVGGSLSVLFCRKD